MPGHAWRTVSRYHKPVHGGHETGTVVASTVRLNLAARAPMMIRATLWIMSLNQEFRE